MSYDQFKIFNPPKISQERLKLHFKNLYTWYRVKFVVLGWAWSESRDLLKFWESRKRWKIHSYKGRLVENHVWPIEWHEYGIPMTWVSLKVIFVVTSEWNASRGPSATAWLIVLVVIILIHFHGTEYIAYNVDGDGCCCDDIVAYVTVLVRQLSCSRLESAVIWWGQTERTVDPTLTVQLTYTVHVCPCASLVVP